MGLFSSPKLTEEHYILDDGRTYQCDWEYAKVGLKEGWLVYIHGYTDYRYVHKHTYAFLPKDTE